MSHFQIRKTSNKQHVPFARFWETFKLDEAANAKVFLINQSKTQKDTYSQGDEIEILRNGNIDFIGEIIFKKETKGGGLFLELKGRELEIIDTKCPTGGNKTKAYTNTDDATILNDLMGAVSGWSADTTNTSAISVTSFRTTDQMSVFRAIKRLIDLTGKDINIDRENKTIEMWDRYPNNTRQNNFNFVEDRDISDFVQKDTRTVSKVIVYGKGDGDTQIKGTAGSGTPVHVVTDKNVISDTEAGEYAQKILNKLQTARFRYEFQNQDTEGTYNLGMGGTLEAPATFEGSKDVDIVKITRGINQNQNETLSFEVTNPDLRRAKKTVAEQQSEQRSLIEIANASMQGTNNVLTFSDQSNANSSTPLRVNAGFPSEFIQDEAGNIRFKSFTIDYDVDPFRSSAGGVSEDNTSPGVTGDTDNHKHDPSDSGHDHNTSQTTSNANSGDSVLGSDSYSTTNMSSGSWYNLASVYVGDASGRVYASGTVYVAGSASVGDDVQLELSTDEGTIGEPFLESGHVIISNLFVNQFKNDRAVTLSGDFNAGGADWVYVRAYSDGNIDLAASLVAVDKEHTHDVDIGYTFDDNAVVDDNNRNPALNASADAHNHNVSIGDAVDDSASINATSVDLHLDYWDGSSWVNKHSITGTGKTLDQDVDISNGGTYPDAPGYWRARIYTNSSSPDLVKGQLKLNHQMDT